MSIVILDNFNGAAGDLTGHAPDVAVGMTDEWQLDSGSGDMVLTGSGGITFDGNSASTTYVLTGDFNIPLPFAMEFVMNGSVTNCQASMRLQDDATGSDVFMDLRTDDSDGPVTGEFRTFTNFSGSGAGNNPISGTSKCRAEWYPDGLVKVYFDDVEVYHGDVNGGNPPQTSHYDRLLVRIQNPASPDINVVDYVLVEALDPNVKIYEDTFTGSAGTVVGHTPDTSPPSFSGYSSGLSLDGSGALVNATGTAGATESEFDADIELEYPFMVSFDVEPLVDGAQLRLNIENTVTSDLIFIDCRWSNGELRIAINGGGSQSWYPGADFGTTRFRMRWEFYEDGTVYLYSSGIFLEIKTVANAPPALSYDRVTFGIDNGGGGNSLIYRASIEQMPTGEAPPEGAPIPVIIQHLRNQGIL